jgi:hypothetical protein
MYTSQQIKLHAREIGDLVADKLECHEEKLSKLESRINALEAAKQTPAQVPAVTVADCVRAMEEAYGLLASYGDLSFTRFAVVRDTLHTAIQRAKGGE